MSVIDTPAGAVSELVNERQKFSKTFDMGDGKRRSINAMRPVHWKDGNNLSEIDLTIKRKGQVYELKTAPYEITLRASNLICIYDHEDGGHVEIQLTHVNDMPVGGLPIQLNPRLIGNRLYLDDFLPNITIYLQVNDGGFSLQKLITADIGPISFTMQMTVDDSPNVKVENRALGRDNYNEISDPDRITQKDFKRQIISTESITNQIDNGDGTNTYTLRQVWDGTVARVDPITRVKSPSTDVIYPVRMHVLVEETIAATSDDGDETNDTTWDDRASGEEFHAGRNDGNTFHGGLHFTTVAIPQGVTIDDATLGLEVLTTFGTPEVTVYADDIDDAAAISSSNRPSQWTKTTANADATTALGTTGARTIDVASIIQEIVDRGGWSTGSDINLGLFHDGGGAGYHIGYIVDITTWGNQNFATLTVNYTEEVGGVAIPIMSHHYTKNIGIH